MECKNCGDEAELKRCKIWLCKECYLKIEGRGETPYDKTDVEAENKFFGLD